MTIHSSRRRFAARLNSDVMQLARVIGNVVSTVKNATLEGRKLLVIQILDGDLRSVGKPLVAVDSPGPAPTESTATRGLPTERRSPSRPARASLSSGVAAER